VLLHSERTVSPLGHLEHEWSLSHQRLVHAVDADLTWGAASAIATTKRQIVQLNGTIGQMAKKPSKKDVNIKRELFCHASQKK
jgi:hypothetical protein